jgi:hypothetical protein
MLHRKSSQDQGHSRVYLTDGSSRRIKVGRQVIYLKRAGPRALLGAGTKAGVALQALRAVGKDRVSHGVVRHLRDNLPPDAKVGLRKLMHKAPQWTVPVIDAITAQAPEIDEQIRVATGSGSGRRSARNRGPNWRWIAAIVEKDFWVCWPLGQIFTSRPLPGPLFKGGTSLSRVYGIIARFLAELAATCSQTVQGSVREILQEQFSHELGVEGWSLGPDIADSEGQSLLFAYPVGLEHGLYGAVGYIRPVVRLEFGCRGDVWPADKREIRPYVAETFPALFASPACPVRVPSPDRTFWEKVTLLHSVTHSGKKPPRLSRHYYDVSRLYRHEVGRRAIADFKLLDQVVKHKTSFSANRGCRRDDSGHLHGFCSTSG